MKKRPLPVLIGIVIVAGGVLLFGGDITVFRMENLDRPAVEWMRISPPEEMTLFYTHSMYGAPVFEEFELRENEIFLKGVRTGHAGVMEYYGFDRVKPFHAVNRSFSAPLIVQRGLSQEQGFVIRGRRIGLERLAEKGDRIEVSVVTMTRGAYICSLIRDWTGTG